MPLSKPAHAKKANPTKAAKSASRPAASAAIGVAEASFLAAFDSILVDEPLQFAFDGSIKRKDMRAYWTWITREIAPELPEAITTAVHADESVDEVIDKMNAQIVTELRKAAAEAQGSPENERRLRAHLGGDEVRDRLPVVINAFRCRALLAKATSFGRASNSLPDEAALGAALQSLPLKESGAVALLFHAIVGQSVSPARLVSSVIPLAGGAKEAVIRGAGYGPLIDAILAHAQNQISRLSSQNGLFSDADLMCKAIARFHKLIRAITGYVELDRGSRWSLITAEVTKLMAQRIEPRLREVSADVSQSLRRPREGADRLDSDRLLAALNGVYLLATLRGARESLALNALFETTWGETGQNLEILLDRNLEILKQNPSDENTLHRLDMGIKMAEIRFNAEYAEILKRARDAAIGKRVAKQA